MSSLRQLMLEVGVSGFVDIAIMALVIYGVLVWLERTRRAATVLTGILIVAGAYLIAQLFDLRLTVAVLNGLVMSPEVQLRQCRTDDSRQRPLMTTPTTPSTACPIR